MKTSRFKSFFNSGKAIRYNQILMDNDELMFYTRLLLNKKELLEKTLRSLNEECDAMQAVLCSSSSEEVAEIIDEFFPEEPSTDNLDSSSEKGNLQKYVNAKNKANVNKFLGVTARETKEGNIIVEFSVPADYAPPTRTFLLFQDVDQVLKLQHHLLPPSVPLAELKEKYLSDDTRDISAFICMIQKYVWSFWIRDMTVKKVKNADYIEASDVYYNKTRTLIVFEVLLHEEFIIEIKLKYDPLFTLPHEITYSEKNETPLTSEVENGLEELKKNLLIAPLDRVLEEVLGSSDAASRASDTSSESTFIYELFK